MRLIQATTISQPIIVDGENVVIAAPDGSRLIINADITVTNGTLMIGGDEVIVDSSRISVRSVNHRTGREEVAYMFLETKHDLHILGSNMAVCGNFSIKSKGNINATLSSLTALGGQKYAAAAAEPLKQHPFKALMQELKQHGAAKLAESYTASASAAGHDYIDASEIQEAAAGPEIDHGDSSFSADFARNLAPSFNHAMSMGESPFTPDHS